MRAVGLPLRMAATFWSVLSDKKFQGGDCERAGESRLFHFRYSGFTAIARALPDRFFMTSVTLPAPGPSHGSGRSLLQSIHWIDCSGFARSILQVECDAAGARPFAWLRAFVAAIDPLDRLLGLRPTAPHPFPIKMPAARTRLPPTTTWNAARRNGVSMYLFWMKAIAQSSKKTMIAAVMVAVQNCGIR